MAKRATPKAKSGRKPAPSRRAPRQIQVVKQVVRARFDAAVSTDDARHWANADALSINASLTPEVRRAIRNRARYERANNAYIHGICVTKSNDLIGTGPRWLPDTGNVEADRLLARRWFDWSWRVKLADKLRTAVEAKIVDGEAFARLVTNPRLDPFGPQLDLRLVEADQVAKPAWQYDDAYSPDGSIVDGVEFDAAGNVVTYYILRAHPGSNYLGDAWTADRVPAEEVLHWFRAIRPGQHRGLSELTACLRLGGDMRRYTAAVVRAAEIAADMAAFVHSNSPAATVDEVEPFSAIDIEKGTLTTLPEGWDVSQLKAEQPTNTHDAFTRTLLREIGRGLNLPFHLTAFDASSYNYSSARLDCQLHQQNVRVERDELERAWLDPLLEEWLDEAAFIQGYIPAGLPPIAEWNWSWVWDGREHVDPVKEATAVEIALATNTTTLADEFARKGQQWDVQLRQRAAEKALMDELGLVDAPAPARQQPVEVVPPDQVTAAADDSFRPTAEMAAEAERGLAWRREFGRGGTEIGVARARDISNRRPLSLDTVERMASYFARHEVDKQGQGWSEGEEGFPSAGRIAWSLWAGDPGRAWANRILDAQEAEA